MQQALENLADEFDNFYRQAQELIDKLNEKKGGANGEENRNTN